MAQGVISSRARPRDISSAILEELDLDPEYLKVQVNKSLGTLGYETYYKTMFKQLFNSKIETEIGPESVIITIKENMK